jgi:hypothetical protein
MAPRRLQKEQLQQTGSDRSLLTAKRTPPQWQDPEYSCICDVAAVIPRKPKNSPRLNDYGMKLSVLTLN